MKVYVHYEDPLLEFTAVIPCQPEDMVATVAQVRSVGFKGGEN